MVDKMLLRLYLIVIFGCSAEGAALALDALPCVLPNGDQHVIRELQTSRMAWRKKLTLLRMIHKESKEFSHSNRNHIFSSQKQLS